MTDFDQRGQRVDHQFNVGNITIHIHANTPPDIASLLQRSIRSMQMKRYDEAIKLIDRVLMEDDSLSDAFYYQALIQLHGRRPALLTKSQADKICQSIEIACELNPQEAHYYYLLAWIKHDFYTVNGFLMPGDRIPAFLRSASRCHIDRPKCEEMILHAGAASDSILVKWIDAQL
ncbi:MAG: hypothetical protein J0H74_14825 [Chitinophagaceae bacterium]|nr:hypothetical protein [Chitinophagaceae bacterium]